MNNNTYIPARFVREIELHVVKNMLTETTVRIPLILGIHGPSGDGKTYQCEQVLEQMDAKAILISGAQLESKDAGEPAKLVQNAYLKANYFIEVGECKVAVVMINDIDIGIGNWGELFQYTVNLQMVIGELMHLADYPNLVEKKKTKRIPIIITGNDFTKLYKPLIRAGRMTSFQWEPTQEDKTKIASHIFPELSVSECNELIKTFQSQPIAFFSSLRSRLIDRGLDKEIERLGIQKIIDDISSDREPEIPLDTRYDNLVQAGKKLEAEGQFTNHLQRS